MELLACSFREFTEFDHEQREMYQTVGMLLEPKDLGIGSLRDKPWGTVKEIQWLYSQPDMTYHSLIYGLALYMQGEESFIETIAEYKWFKVWEIYNYVVKELKYISEVEQKFLNFETPERENDILEPLSSYGFFSTLDGLAGGDLTKYDEIEKKPWELVFTKLRYDKDKSEVEQKLIKLHNNGRS